MGVSDHSCWVRLAPMLLTVSGDKASMRGIAKAHGANHLSFTLNATPQVLDHKPQTLNPKTLTLTPKP